MIGNIIRFALRDLIVDSDWDRVLDKVVNVNRVSDINWMYVYGQDTVPFRNQVIYSFLYQQRIS